MKPASIYKFPFVLPQRAFNLTAICVVTTALAACGGSGGGTVEGGSDPLFTDSVDTDNDGLTDEEEALIGTDPNDPTDADGDLDGDGLSNLAEVIGNTNPNARDTDDDGVFDNEELSFNSDPNDPSDFNADFDGDGVGNLDELLANTDPADATSFPDDTDGGTTPVVDCADTNSSNSDWGDNCQLQRFGVFADSLYTMGAQRILWCQGFGGGVTFDTYTDGEFGPGTERSVIEFQTANGLTSDGIIGPQTWASLRSKLVTEPDVEIGGVTYAPHIIEGCDFDGAQFYQEIVFGELGGWKMAATPGSTTLIDFSTGSPF